MFGKIKHSIKYKKFGKNRLQKTIEYKKRMNKAQNMFGNIYR